ncbi:UDP-glucose 4-epimerase [Consotaella salsifontis]|uniref:UDP-glucose 4-epimerase n=1 Tax=Consotaella salsifontis TaxID=1365950 RepID=A0A1T4P5Z6_9HYPH|nr:UDP-glucose 4-epimerase [Consotaella salsifontis]
MEVCVARNEKRGGRILVTGGTGFIGRHVVAALLEQGREIVLAVGSNSLVPANFQKTATVQTIPDGFDELDVSLFEGVDQIVHLAGLAAVPRGEPEPRKALESANILLTRQLVKLATTLEVGSFVNMSSVRAIVGNSSGGVVDDALDEEPLDLYGQTKREAEKCVEGLAHRGAFAISLRPPLVIGSEAKGNWRSLMKLAATGWPLPFASVRNERSFISVQTLAEAIVLLCGRAWPAEASGEYAIADPAPLSLAEVIRLLRVGMDLPQRIFFCPPAAFELMGKLTGRSRQVAGLTGSLRIDPSRFYSTFGFTPTLSLAEAIRMAGRDYQIKAGRQHFAPGS